MSGSCAGGTDKNITASATVSYERLYLGVYRTIIPHNRQGCEFSAGRAKTNRTWLTTMVRWFAFVIAAGLLRRIGVDERWQLSFMTMALVICLSPKKLSAMMGMPMDDPYALLHEGGTRVNPYNGRMQGEIEYYERGDIFDECALWEFMPYLDLPPIFIDVAAEIIRVDEERALARGKDESIFLHGRYDKTKDRARAVARWGEDWKLGDPVPDCVKNGVPDVYNI